MFLQIGQMIGILVLLALCRALPAVAQYPNAEKTYMMPLQRSADSILTSGHYVTPMDVEILMTKESPDFHLRNTPKTKRNKRLTTEALYRKTLPAIGLVAMCTKANPLHPVKINCASAFFIDNNGICVTNYHVIYAYAHSVDSLARGAFLVRTGAGKIYPLQKVLAFSAEDDLAILQLDLQCGQVAALNLADSDPEIGADIFVLGNPLDLSYSITRGIVSSKYNKLIGLPGGLRGAERNLLSITAEFAVGASGSPVLNNRGEVAGIVSSTQVIEQNNIGRPQAQMVVRSVVPVSSLKKLLEKY